MVINFLIIIIIVFLLFIIGVLWGHIQTVKETRKARRIIVVKYAGVPLGYALNNIAASQMIDRIIHEKMNQGTIMTVDDFVLERKKLEHPTYIK